MDGEVHGLSITLYNVSGYKNYDVLNYTVTHIININRKNGIKTCNKGTTNGMMTK